MTFRSSRSVVVAAGLLVAACSYTFSGGGGLPPHVRTIFVEPVDNQTTQFPLTEQITSLLLDAARSNLGAQLGAEEDADATIRTALTRYEDTAVNFAAQEGLGADVFQRRIRISARVEIVDNVRNEIIWGGSVTGIGEYDPDNQTELDGQEIALEDLRQKIVDGAQSQW
ncbi:MAG: DUF4136 domain-containing protein [Gemmatimonadota bacterium]|nr:DUF4136 domain-containing protein [Gemmatimonadota bacterium]